MGRLDDIVGCYLVVVSEIVGEILLRWLVVVMVDVGVVLLRSRVMVDCVLVLGNFY